MNRDVIRVFSDTLRDYIVGNAGASEGAFQFALGFRHGLALSNAITPEEHTRMCRMTDAAIDARCYISERKWGAA